MTFTDIIYLAQGNYLDGRAIVVFDTSSEFRIDNSECKEFISYISGVILKAILISKEQSHNDEFCVVVHLDNLKKCKIGFKIPICIARTLKRMFPDKLYKCYLKNPPMIFRAIYTAVSPLIDKVTRRKISIIKNGKEIEYDKYS